jgi:hypothetical protein
MQFGLIVINTFFFALANWQNKLEFSRQTFPAWALRPEIFLKTLLKHSKPFYRRGRGEA